jgi:hypothetical protein
VRHVALRYRLHANGVVACMHACICAAAVSHDALHPCFPLPRATPPPHHHTHPLLQVLCDCCAEGVTSSPLPCSFYCPRDHMPDTSAPPPPLTPPCCVASRWPLQASDVLAALLGPKSSSKHSGALRATGGTPPSLPQLFSVGQYVRCVVRELPGGGEGDTAAGGADKSSKGVTMQHRCTAHAELCR